MEKPKPPLCRIIREGDGGPYCPKCKSTLKYKFWPFMKSKYCIQPKCENYYQKKNSERKVKMERVIIESPYAADTEEGIDLNEAYAELCMHDCLVNHNEAPYASHLLYTRRFVLRDDVPADRKLGIEAGFFWRDVAQKTVFYKDLGWTRGMKKGIDDCVKKGTPSAVRNLPANLWGQLLDYCYEAEIDEPKKEVV